MRQRAWDWVQTVALTRLAPNASVIMIGTRWHEDDVTGRMLKNDPDRWISINIPAYAVENDPLNRRPGERLWPERFDEAYFAERRNTMSKYFWAALYEGRPIPDTGGHVNVERFRMVDLDDVPASGRFVRYWDLAVKEKTQADFTAGALCALDGGTLWIVDIASGQWEWPASRANIVARARVDRCQVGIESVGTGSGLAQNLREVFPSDLLLTETTPDKDKLTRALPWFAAVNCGNVRLVRGGWNNEFLAQCHSFPNGAHDDLVDAVSGAYHILAQPVPGRMYAFEESRRYESVKNRKQRILCL
jgi:predicted phage terminase large subunit-like protein